MSGVEQLDGARSVSPAPVSNLGGSGQGLTRLDGQEIRRLGGRTTRVGGRVSTGRMLPASGDLVHTAGGLVDPLPDHLLIGLGPTNEDQAKCDEVVDHPVKGRDVQFYGRSHSVAAPSWRVRNLAGHGHLRSMPLGRSSGRRSVDPIGAEAGWGRYGEDV